MLRASVWLREGMGWLLIVAGLYVFLRVALAYLGDARPAEASISAFIGFVVFRGGIHLVKVTTAARLVLAARAQDRDEPGRLVT